MKWQKKDMVRGGIDTKAKNGHKNRNKKAKTVNRQSVVKLVYENNNYEKVNHAFDYGITHFQLIHYS